MRGRKRHRKKLKKQILREQEAHLRQQIPAPPPEDLAAILREMAESLDRLLRLR